MVRRIATLPIDPLTRRVKELKTMAKWSLRIGIIFAVLSVVEPGYFRNLAIMFVGASISAYATSAALKSIIMRQTIADLGRRGIWSITFIDTQNFTAQWGNQKIQGSLIQEGKTHIGVNIDFRHD